MRKLWGIAAFILFITLTTSTQAQTINLDANALVPEVSLSLSPNTGSFTQDSTFTVPILLNTKGRSVNSVEIEISFDPRKLSIVGPSGETSIIGVWAEPPVYDNTNGTARYVGVIPGGIITSSGVVSSVTFKARQTGRASILFNADSKVLLNDGLGSEARVTLGRADYTILPEASPGVSIFSETHPDQNEWYNNNNPIISWEKEVGVTGFSYELDNKPGTIPDNEVDSTDTTLQFTDLEDGIWYFHIKSNKNGIWGGASTFIVRVDTAPPAEFTPTTDYLLASVALVERALVSFFTTDNLSGVDRYEVGVIDKSQPATVTPLFIESESPFQVPLNKGTKLHVVVRAFDRAGNVRESGIDVSAPFFISDFLRRNSINLMMLLLITIIIFFILHYLIGHHVIRHLKKALRAYHEDEDNDNHSPPPLDLRKEPRNPEASYPPTDHVPRVENPPSREL